MGAKMTARLCTASVVAGAVITPPALRMAKRQAAKAARNGARGYIKVREQFGKMADATGRPGEFAAMFAAFTAQAAKDATGKWWELVADVEREQEEARKTYEAQPKSPPETIDDYMSNEHIVAPG